VVWDSPSNTSIGWGCGGGEDNTWGGEVGACACIVALDTKLKKIEPEIKKEFSEERVDPSGKWERKAQRQKHVQQV
jgi:hypothetical protein